MTNPIPGEFDAPVEFDEHVQYMHVLLQQVKSEGLRRDLTASIERLVAGLRDEWFGSTVAFNAAAPDDAATLFDA